MQKHNLLFIALISAFLSVQTHSATGSLLDVRVVSKSPSSYTVETLSGRIKINRPASSENILEHGLKTSRLVRYFVPSEAEFIRKYAPVSAQAEKIESIRF